MKKSSFSGALGGDMGENLMSKGRKIHSEKNLSMIHLCVKIHKNH